jgi:hypothetical protein
MPKLMLRFSGLKPLYNGKKRELFAWLEEKWEKSGLSYLTSSRRRKKEMESGDILNKPFKIQFFSFSRSEKSKGGTIANPGTLECSFEICQHVWSNPEIHFESIPGVAAIWVEKCKVVLFGCA